MLDEVNDPNILTSKAALTRFEKRPFAMVSNPDGNDLDYVMNGPIRQKLKIIPTDVR